MKKNRSILPVFLLIVVQSTIAISAGVAALFLLSQKTLPPGICVGDVRVGAMEYPKAAKAVESGFNEKFNRSSIKLQIENKTYDIPYSQINARVDGDATVNSLKPIDGITGLLSMLNAYFGGTKPVLQPVIKLNEGKLREALMDVADKMYVAPVDASISLKDGIIVKKAETDGVSLDINNAAELIKRQISENPWNPVTFKRAGNYELKSVPAEHRLKDYDDIQQVLAVYSTDILDKELLDGMQLAVDGINGKVLPAAGKNGKAYEFSFVECMMEKNADFENDNEGYDQVASTLYAALLTAGIPADSITRLPHKLAVDYIEPGLDAWISGSGGDLRFTNPFSHKLAVFAQIKSGRIEVALAGDITDKKENYKITTEVIQQFAPPVYYVENDRLKPGEKVVLNPGKAGVMVNVYRNGELIGPPDKYEAEKAIVQIGPGTRWKDEIK